MGGRTVKKARKQAIFKTAYFRAFDTEQGDSLHIHYGLWMDESCGQFDTGGARGSGMAGPPQSPQNRGFRAPPHAKSVGICEAGAVKIGGYLWQVRAVRPPSGAAVTFTENRWVFVRVLSRCTYCSKSRPKKEEKIAKIGGHLWRFCTHRFVPIGEYSIPSPPTDFLWFLKRSATWARTCTRCRQRTGRPVPYPPARCRLQR